MMSQKVKNNALELLGEMSEQESEKDFINEMDQVYEHDGSFA